MKMYFLILRLIMSIHLMIIYFNFLFFVVAFVRGMLKADLYILFM